MAIHRFASLLLLFLMAQHPLDSRAADQQVVALQDNGKGLLNPGMGWVFHYYDDKLEEYGRQLPKGDTLNDFPGMAVAYMRLPWSLIEPERGVFHWDVIDTPARQWMQSGKRIALRFTSAESHEPTFATPEWVKRAGARGYYFEPGKGVVAVSQHWEPDYDDPVFLAELDQFLAAAAARYDGQPGVDFVDAGSFGVWGEGHTLSSSLRAYDEATVRRIVDLYRKHFRQTQLVCNDDFTLQGRGPGIIRYCQEHGLTLRDDSILVAPGADAYLSAALAQPFWPGRPVILESQYYGIVRAAGYWDGGRKYLEAMEAYHASYLSAHGAGEEFLQENRPLIEHANRRLGYRLVLTEVALPEAIGGSGQMRVQYKIRNAGVAPCLPGGQVAFTLRREDGEKTGNTFVDRRTFDVKDLVVGPEGESPVRTRSFLFDTSKLARGRYSVWVSAGDARGRPVFELPLALPELGRQYRVGYLRLE